MLLDINDPQKMGLLSLGLRLMSTPGKFGAALGQSGLGALGDMQQVAAQNDARKSRGLQQQLLMQQLEQAKALQEAQKAQAARQQAVEAAYRDSIVSPAQQALASGGGPTVANAQAMQGLQPTIDQNRLIQGLMQADPMAAFQRLQPTPADYKVVDGALVQTNAPGGPKAVYERQKPVDWNQLIVTGPDGKPMLNTMLSDAKQRIAAAGAARTNINTPFENAFDKASGAKFAETYDTINTAGMTAGQQIARLDRMEELLTGVEGGKLAPLGKEIASFANSFGVQLDPNLGNKEAAESLSREIAASFRQPGTGPMTDKDFDNFLTIVPNLSKSAEGRRQITQTLRAKAMRDVQMSQLAQDYVAKNGKLDTGFYKVAQQFISANPVVQNKPAQSDGWSITPVGR